MIATENWVVIRTFSPIWPELTSAYSTTKLLLLLLFNIFHFFSFYFSQTNRSLWKSNTPDFSTTGVDADEGHRRLCDKENHEILRAWDGAAKTPTCQVTQGLAEAASPTCDSESSLAVSASLSRGSGIPEPLSKPLTLSPRPTSDDVWLRSLSWPSF